MSRLPRNTRMAYLVALVRDVPLQVACDAELGEPLGDDLPVLATRTVGDCRIQFALVPDRPRFRLMFTDRYPSLLGHVTGLDGPTPLLHVVDRLHWDWARVEGTTAAIRDIAAFTWYHRGRLLEEASRTS